VPHTSPQLPLAFAKPDAAYSAVNAAENEAASGLPIGRAATDLIARKI